LCIIFKNNKKSGNYFLVEQITVSEKRNLSFTDFQIKKKEKQIMFGLIGGVVSGLLGGGGGGGLLGGILGGLTKAGGLGSLLEGVLGKDSPFSKLFSALNPSKDVLSNVTNMLSSIIGGGEK
jgi:hypothetical protein